MKLGYRGYSASRDENEGSIVAALEIVGATVVRLDMPCDLLVGFRSNTYLVEIKVPGAKLTSTQNAFLRSWRGSPVRVVTNEREALEAIGAVR